MEEMIVNTGDSENAIVSIRVIDEEWYTEEKSGENTNMLVKNGPSRPILVGESHG